MEEIQRGCHRGAPHICGGDVIDLLTSLERLPQTDANVLPKLVQLRARQPALQPRLGKHLVESSQHAVERVRGRDLAHTHETRPTEESSQVMVRS